MSNVLVTTVRSCHKNTPMKYQNHSIKGSKIMAVKNVNKYSK
jgi:hypothetical protein